MILEFNVLLMLSAIVLSPFQQEKNKYKYIVYFRNFEMAPNTTIYKIKYLNDRYPSSFDI